MLDDSLVKSEIASFPGDNALFCSVCRESANTVTRRTKNPS